MRLPRRDSAYPLALAALAFVIALVQRPGLASSDTKIDLHVDPRGFLADVASVWTPSGSLGHVQGGQYGGYLFPMGPFFALGRAIGLAPWLVDRLWLGTVLALAAWGTVRLLDAIYEPRRGVAHVVAGVFVVLNPYTVVFVERTSVTLLAYAALPWLLLAVHRGVRAPRRWFWPAAFALVLTASGGGVNAAVTAWVLLGPIMLLGYEVLFAGIGRRDAGAFAVRTAAASLVASLWWIAPALVQARYGIDFLRFTEQPGTIWGTTSVSESLRLMGYWISYIGVGFHGPLRPYYGDARVMLFQPLVVAAGLIVPGLALGSFAWTRRRRYVPFLLAMTLFGVVVMVVGFPEGTPLRQGLHFSYNHFSATHFLRTSYKAGPLVAIGMASLAGAGAAVLVRRLAGRRFALAGAALVAAALVALQAWPLVRGRGVDGQLLWHRIPSAWTDTAHDLDRTLPANTRAVVLPGQLFAYYRWGGTVDPILPALTNRPVADRNIVPFADLHAIDMFWTVDGLVDQERLLPGQLPPLLSLLDAGAVVSNSDDDIRRSGAPAPADAARTLAGQPGFARPARNYGPQLRMSPGAGELGATTTLPQVRRYDTAGTRGIVRVEPDAAPTVLDGSAVGIAGLAAFGALPRDAPLRYAGDLGADALRRSVRSGGEVVITDSNRRRVFVSSNLEQNYGTTLAAGDPISQDAAVLNPFASRGTDGQTLAQLSGAAYLRAPFSPSFAQFPEHRPFAAFDGSTATSWLADSALNPERQWIEVGFGHRRDVSYVDVVPHDDAFARTARIDVGGDAFDVHPGVNHLRVDLHGIDRLRFTILSAPYRAGLRDPGSGGFDEIRVPGLRITDALRPPVLAERALAGRALTHTGLTYLLERTTGDTPFRRQPLTGPAQDSALRDRADGEVAFDRILSPPAARAYRLDAWVTAAPDAPDHVLDRLAGQRGPQAFDSSARFEGMPGLRASRAFEAGGRPRDGWIGEWIGGGPAWIGWRVARPMTVRSLRLTRSAQTVRFPTQVRLRTPTGATAPVAVGPGGEIALPRAVRARSFRLEILAARFPAGTRGQALSRRAVGIGRIAVPELAGPRIARAGPLAGGCDGPRVGAAGRDVALRVTATVADLDAGRALRARGCGPPLALPAGTVRLHAGAGTFRVSLLRLRSPAPVPAAAAGVASGRVLDPGRAGRGTHDGVRVDMPRRSWLVLGESFDRGWRAYCDGRSLGTPVVLDGYANGWLAPAGCNAVHFGFAPQRGVLVAYLLSALACLALLAVLLLRRPTRAPAVSPADLASGPPTGQMPARRALAAGVLAGAVLGFMFSLRAGVLIGPAVALLLWRGVGARVLALAGGLLLAVVVPAVYLLFPSPDQGGYDFNYAVDLIAAHWVAVGGIVLIGLALWRTLAASRRVRPTPAREPADGVSAGDAAAGP